MVPLGNGKTEERRSPVVERPPDDHLGGCDLEINQCNQCHCVVNVFVKPLPMIIVRVAEPADSHGAQDHAVAVVAGVPAAYRHDNFI